MDNDQVEKELEKEEELQVETRVSLGTFKFGPAKLQDDNEEDKLSEWFFVFPNKQEAMEFIESSPNHTLVEREDGTFTVTPPLLLRV